jgi:hypothetical protein
MMGVCLPTEEFCLSFTARSNVLRQGSTAARENEVRVHSLLSRADQFHFYEFIQEVSVTTPELWIEPGRGSCRIYMSSVKKSALDPQMAVTRNCYAPSTDVDDAATKTTTTKTAAKTAATTKRTRRTKRTMTTKTTKTKTKDPLPLPLPLPLLQVASVLLQLLLLLLRIPRHLRPRPPKLMLRVHSGLLHAPIVRRRMSKRAPASPVLETMIPPPR